MRVQTIPEFAKEHGFIQVVDEIRLNTNGYPYVTFINKDNEAENVYLSKAAGEKVHEGEQVTPLLKQWQVGHTENADGEPRVKLISNSDRVDLSSIFEQEFSGNPAVEVPT